jgi:hypothetical protein
MRKLDEIDAEIAAHKLKISALETERDHALRNITVINPRSVSPKDNTILGI